MGDLYSSRKGKHCIIYIRVSSERQIQGYSLEGQKRYLKEWCEFEGMTVIKIYVEPGKGRGLAGGGLRAGGVSGDAFRYSSGADSCGLCCCL